MADPVSLILGITPLVLTAIKTYGTIYAKFKIYRQYARVMMRLQKQLVTQRRLFINECHLLLRLVVEDEKIITEMLKNSEHEGWDSNSLDQQWRECLEENYEACMTVIEEICEALQSLDSEFVRFAPISAEVRKGEHMKHSMRKTRDAIKVALDSTKYERTIADLRTSNGDLKMLRKHVKNFQCEQFNTSPSSKYSSKGQSSHITCFKHQEIRRASQELHTALRTAWSCSEVTHYTHSAKLSLNANFDNGVYMNLIVLSDSCRVESRSEDAVNLSVHSQRKADFEMVMLPYNTLTPQVLSPRNETESFACLDSISSPNGSNNPAPSATEIRAVYFSDDCATGTIEDKLKRRHSATNLRDSPDVCLELTQQATKSDDNNCIGYLDTTINNFRLLFFRMSHTIASFDLKTKGELVHVCDIFIRHPDDTLTVVDQLKLARVLVSAMLQFCSTPWLAEYWGLKDISYFQSGNEFTEAILRSLHVSTKFTTRNNSSQSSMDGTESSGMSPLSLIEDAKLRYGVRSLPLYSLGVVLLQVGRWTPLDADDICQVRRLAGQSSRLGPRYNEITRKCLDCDFGFGADINEPQLRRAVADSVLKELSKMISSLDINVD